MMRFLSEKGWSATALKRVDWGRSKSGGKRERIIDGGGMLVGGASATSAGGDARTPSALSQAQASASIPVVGRGDFTAGTAGRSSKSPHSSSALFGAGESSYGSGFGGAKFGHAVTGDAVFGMEPFFTFDNCFVASIGPRSPNGFLSWKDGDFGACGYGRPPAFKPDGCKFAGRLEGLSFRLVAPNIFVRD